MSIAENQVKTWSPKLIIFSIVLHAIVIYAIAAAFKIVPAPIDLPDPPTIETVRFTPPPPRVEPDPTDIKKPPFPIRQPKAAPVPVPVPPVPLPPSVTPVDAGPPSIRVQGPIAEQPVVFGRIPYPRRAEVQQVEGRVVLSITILPDGSVRDIQVVSARPIGYFEETAVRAVSQWRYRPSNVIRYNVIIEIDFKLQ